MWIKGFLKRQLEDAYKSKTRTVKRLISSEQKIPNPSLISG